jgi:hypothetical protein
MLAILPHREITPQRSGHQRFSRQVRSNIVTRSPSLIAALLTPAKAKEHHKFCHRPARTHSGRLGIMKTGDFQMPFFGKIISSATSLTGLRRAGHSIWLRASTTALLSLVSSVSAGITSSRHDAHLDKLRPNASHRLRDPCRGASVHRRQPEFRGRDSEPAARRF